MKFFTAESIHNGYGWLEKPSVLAFSDQGVFEQILPRQEVDPLIVQKFEGYLCPGFVNAHCHLELSHLKGAFPEREGLAQFLSSVVGQRNHAPEQIQEAIKKAGLAMLEAGIVALGDIANTTDTLSWRGKAPMHVHTFVETMGLVPQFVERRFHHAKEILEQFQHQGSCGNCRCGQSIVPHAPYSVARELFALIDAVQQQAPISIHNQECAAENQYFKSKTGAMQDLYAHLHISDDDFEPSGKTSLQTFLPWLLHAPSILLVHNTFTSKEDIAFVKAQENEVHFCLCPNANLYIEDALPDIDLLHASDLNICLGTDSLASNHQLDIYAEVRTILNHYKHLSEEVLLRWATLNGARALGFDDLVGSFEKGKMPGLVQVHQAQSRRVF